MRITEVDRELTQTELDQLETFADRLFAKLGIDVEFTRHFLDRVNDERNVKQITVSELTRLFKQEYKKWGKDIVRLGPDSEAVMKDLATDVNVPFALRWDSANNELDLIAKTVMRKPDFKTSNPQFKIEYTLKNKDIDIIMEGLPALNNGGALGTGLTPGEFQSRFGMSPANANKTLGSVVELFPDQFKNNPRFKPFIKQYIMNPKQLGNLQAVNDNIKSLEDWKKKNANNKSWKQFFKKAPLRALGSFVTFMFTPSSLGDGTIQMDQRIVMDTLGELTKADPKAMIELIQSSYPDTYEDNWYYKNAVQEYSEQVIKQLDGKVDPGLQREVDKIKKAKDMEKWSSMPLDPGLQKALDASQPEVDFTTGPEKMGEPAPNIDPPNIPDPANDPEPIRKPEVIPFPNPRPDEKPKVKPEPIKKPDVDPENPTQPDEPEVKPDEKPKVKPDEKPEVIPFPPPPEAPEIPEIPDPLPPEPAPNVDPTAPVQPTAPNVEPEVPNVEPDTAPKIDPDAPVKPQQPADPDGLPTAPEKPTAPKVEPTAPVQPKIPKVPKVAPSEIPDIQPAPVRNPDKDPLPVPNYEPVDDPIEIPSPIEVPAPIKIEPAPEPITQPEPITNPDVDPAPITKPEIMPTPGNITAPSVDILPVPQVRPVPKLKPKQRIPQKQYRRREWDTDGYNDLYKTNLYKWTQKYGTFENSKLNNMLLGLNESIIMEGGAMPGVGAIHIDEINPTLEQLEKSLGLDLKNFTLGSVGKRQFSGDIDVALNLPPEELPAFVEKLKKNPLIKDIAKSSVIMTKVQIQGFDKSKSDGRPRTGFVQVDFMPGDPGWLKTYFHSPSEDESKYKGVFRNVMVATMAAVHNRDDSDAEVEDGRPLESRRFMWSPTDGLVRVLRTPVPAKNGNGYTKKNQNKVVDGPWKQADDIAKQLGLNSAKDLNSFESLLDAMKKSYTQEEQQKVINNLKDSKVVQDIGIPDEIKDL